MARITKQSIDFFPHDVNFNNKFELFIAENGPENREVLVTPWQLINGSLGCFIEHSDDLLLRNKRRLHPNVNLIREILEAAVRHGNVTDRRLTLEYCQKLLHIANGIHTVYELDQEAKQYGFQVLADSTAKTIHFAEAV